MLSRTVIVESRLEVEELYYLLCMIRVRVYIGIRILCLDLLDFPCETPTNGRDSVDVRNAHKIAEDGDTKL